MRRRTLGSCIKCPSYPITPLTFSPDAFAFSDRKPASSGLHPHLCSPTLTSIKTSFTPANTAASIVSNESTATVIRQLPSASNSPIRLASSVSFAKRRSLPKPAFTIPSNSRIVAQQKVSCPASTSFFASAVDLKAFTCGRSSRPGLFDAIVAIFVSKIFESAISAGVVRSLVFIVYIESKTLFIEGVTIIV